jgi:hypothetical protein
MYQNTHIIPQNVTGRIIKSYSPTVRINNNIIIIKFTKHRQVVSYYCRQSQAEKIHRFGAM